MLQVDLFFYRDPEEAKEPEEAEAAVLLNMVLWSMRGWGGTISGIMPPISGRWELVPPFLQFLLLIGLQVKVSYLQLFILVVNNFLAFFF